jgi:hypothetical protein
MSIHLLADQGDKSGVAQCIAARANVNEADTTGQKPLHYAAAKGYADLITQYISLYHFIFKLKFVYHNKLAPLHFILSSEFSRISNINNT